MTEELKTIETVDTSPFKRMVMTIGELPSSFVDSMTYYELLAWLCNYLQNTVIPTVNNNAEAVEELQALYIELKTFVDDYFDNLDVQEEINNKLDEMAENGQLTELIAQFLSLNAVMSFPSVASMKLAENLVNGSTTKTYGYYAKGDGGGATYYVRTVTNDDVVDEKTIIALYDDLLIAELMPESTMTPEQFGCKGDDSTDDTSGMTTAINFTSTHGSILHLNQKTYQVKTLRLKNNTTIEGEGSNSILKGSALASVSDNRILYGGNQSNIKLSNFKVDVNGTNRTNVTSSDIAVSIAGNSHNVDINRLTIIAGTATNSYGIRIGSVDSVRPSNITIDNCEITVPDTGFNGIAVTGGKNIWITNNTINNPYNNTGYAIDIEANETADTSIDYFRINDVYLNNNICNGNGIQINLKDNPTSGNVILSKNIINYSNNNTGTASEPLCVGGAYNVDVVDNIINYNNNSGDNTHSYYSLFRITNDFNLKVKNNEFNINEICYCCIRGSISNDITNTNILIYGNNIFCNSKQMSRVIWLATKSDGIILKNNNIFNGNSDYSILIENTAKAGSLIIENNNVFGTKGYGLSSKNFTSIFVKNNYIAGYRNILNTSDTVVVNNNIFHRLSGSYDVFNNDPSTDNTSFTYSNNNVIGVTSGTLWQSAKNILSSNAAPASKSWKKGDIVINSNPASGQPMGWICTAAGTPGTWTAMSNL